MKGEADFASLSGTLDAAWSMLAAGAARAGPARHLVLATEGARGPEARLVVLRAADRIVGTLALHTDSASSKVGDLRRNPRATVLAWDADRGFQVRLRVHCAVRPGSTDEWTAIPEAARCVYGGTRPGTALVAPEAVARRSDPARFAVVTARIDEIETLLLGPPHRRARFRGEDAVWLAP